MDAVRRVAIVGRGVEDGLAATVLLAMAALPVLEFAARAILGAGIPGAIATVQNLTLWIAMLGALIASREGRHLGLSTAMLHMPPALGACAGAFAAAVSAAVAAGLFWAGLQFVLAETASPTQIGGWLPIWVAEAILPVGFAIIAIKFVVLADGWRRRVVAGLGIPAAAAIGFALPAEGAALAPFAIAGLAAAALLGAPIFVVLGGAALLLFFADGVPVAAISVETYRLVASPSISAIPLFTLTGYLLAEGGASRRLVRLFRALLAWMPGGMVAAATLVCAFFTTFTGASGVTILALGGLLLPALVENGYRKRFSLGLLTATGSIGLLFPPSLAVILYAVVAHVSILDLFVAGIVPGMIMVAAICLFGLREGLRRGTPRPRFEAREAVAALWQSKWELLLPVVLLAGIFGGITTLTEAAALSVVYALVVEILIHRDLDAARDLPAILVKCATLIGGVMVILGVAMGLTNYFVDAEVPTHAAAWVSAHVESRIVFLLALNVFLLLVGCLMDIFSAIVVVVPLILPASQAFGIDPLHLALIFLVNLELGYLTPPVGMNLFLASYRFDVGLVEVYRSAVPFLVVLGLVVLLVTFAPGLIIGVGW